MGRAFERTCMYLMKYMSFQRAYTLAGNLRAASVSLGSGSQETSHKSPYLWGALWVSRGGEAKEKADTSWVCRWRQTPMLLEREQWGSRMPKREEIDQCSVRLEVSTVLSHVWYIFRFSSFFIHFNNVASEDSTVLLCCTIFSWNLFVPPLNIWGPFSHLYK